MNNTQKNIVLTGLMGSGKTTLGKYISEKIGMEFVDTDEIIIQKAGKSISEIFEEQGEPYFRDLESEAVLEASLKHGCVISTGGGAVLREVNIDNLKKTGVLFYLEASPEELYNRIKDDSSRPLLRGDDPVEILRRVLLARRPYYETADFKITTENRSLEEIYIQVIELFKKA
jgi:shikimate kinase